MSAEKKTDRRTLYTKNVIQEAFLALKENKRFGDITVADICRAAEISRGTFYLHYCNTAEVLDAVLDEALSETRSLSEQLYPETCGSGAKCGYPMCHYIRNTRKYRCLFFDEQLSSVILEKIYAASKDKIIADWAERTSLPPERLERIAYFQLSGCFAVARRSRQENDAQWEESQQAIDTFIRGGIQSLK